MHALLGILKSKNLMLTTAESCTGGLISAIITEIPGSSSIFDRGFVTYSNEAKQEQLGVSPEIIESHGAVSQECARAMAEGALKNSHADIAVSVTGVAGPDGGSEEKPVGLVYIGIATKEKTNVTKCNFAGDRNEVRQSAVTTVFDLLTKTALAI